ncbi:MAG: hypothetical protein COY38_03060 [Candidatus Aenigmarchaeota archaeon CG_4_10_14_0_8_um_filter_37_24]|nr:hypothetical protein [Candidatus Aenigmarchaeota archaeon]NCS71078.1 hypothetical protein [Candidatus Aenigmarchaeota archaeon]PIZ34981.1 MAG: hypothetical protein COY38_03060 [Candidatus Aenigmarchaeota archaeon CG_4_10_14_0_8_um_filter_37_24]
MSLFMKLEKSDIKYLLLFFAVTLLLFLLIKKIPSILIFIGLTLLTGLIVFLNYFLQIPVDFTPVFFLSIIITSTLGFGYTFLFVILAGFIPGIFSGDFKPSVFVYLIINLLVNLASIPLNLNFITESIILSFLYGGLVVIIRSITESDFGQELFVNLITFGINIFYFWKLGEALISIFQV